MHNRKLTRYLMVLSISAASSDPSDSVSVYMRTYYTRVNI